MISMLSDGDRKELKRELFKSAVLSAVFSLFKSRKKQAMESNQKYLMQDLANDAGVTKSQVSRWFNGELSPNWRLSTLFDMVEALDGEVCLEVIDRRTKEIHGSSGLVTGHMAEAYSLPAAEQLYPVTNEGELIDIAQWIERANGTSIQDQIFYAAGDARATSAA